MVSDVFSIRFDRPNGSSRKRAATASEFIGGPENQLAHVAAQALRTDLRHFNPLVFCGPTQVGKSLLARGLVDLWKADHPQVKPVVVTGPDWARQYAEALDTDCVADFRQRFRQADLLLIDDLHLIADKPAAQTELTNTLDALLDRDTPVLVTLPELPVDCSGLDPALASRLSSGLCVPLVPPGPNVRSLFLRRLADCRKLELPDDVVDLLAQHAGPSPPSFSQLNSLLMQLETAATVENRPLDAKLVRFLMDDHAERRTPTLAKIAKAVSTYFELRVIDLKGATRRQNVVHARSVAMYLARKLTGQSLEHVGRYFGDRDHTTVLHACRKTDSLVSTDPSTRLAVDELTRQLMAM